MDDRTKRKVCEMVAGILATDGELNRDELIFMLRIFAEFGVATAGDDEVVSPRTSTAEAAKAMAELDESVRAEAMQLLIDSAAADGKVTREERSYLLSVAKAAGMSEEALDARIVELVGGVSA